MEENIDKIKCEACNREFAKPEDLAMHNYAKHNLPLNNPSENKDSENLGINKKIIFQIIGILIVIIVGYFFISGKNVTGNTILDNSKDVQKITLSFKNYNYYPNTVTVEVGKPVEITLDSSIRGCYRSFNIRDFGVSIYSQSPSQKIIFTPTKKGSFEFACGMRMGYGIIKVI